MDEDFIGGKPTHSVQTDNARVVLHGEQLTVITEALNHIHALRLDNEALRKRVDRLYDHIGLRG